MKKVKFILALPVLGLFLSVNGCDQDGIKKNPTIGGNTDFAENQVGSTSKLNVSGDDSEAQLKVIDNQGGVITVEATFTIPAKYKSTIENLGETFYGSKTKFIDSQGKFKSSFKVKNSSEGIAFYDPKDRQVVAMKYDSKVGDKWSFDKANGEKIDFEVSYKSETDDFSYAFFDIKVVKVEQIFHEPGITKIVYIGNHKFGLVGIEFYLEDGTIIKTSRI